MAWPDSEPDPKKIITVFRHPPPHDKDIEIHLLYLAAPNAYQVKQVTNTTWYKPGDWLNEEIVAQICKLPKWKVVIENYEWLQKAFNLVGSFVHIP